MHRVTGTWESGGARVAGTYRVKLPVRVTDTSGDVVHHRGLYSSGSLSVAAEPAYSLDINVPATDDPDLSPQGWEVEIQVAFTSGGSEVYTIPAPDGGTTDLSDVILPQGIPEAMELLIRGVPGGIAELDVDGDVVDADGNKVLSGASGQPLDSDLTAIAAIAPSNDDLIQRKAGAWTNRAPAQVKTDLVLVKGDVGLGNADNTSDANKPVSTATQAALDGKQPLDSDLTAIAAIAPSNDDIVQRKAGAWTNRTLAQVKTDLGFEAALNISGGAMSAADYGWSGWSVDPLLALSTSVLPTGEVTFQRVKIQTAGAISNVVCVVTTGVSVTGAWAGVYSMAGTLLGATANTTAAFGSSGIKTMALTTPTASQDVGTTVLVALLAVGGTPTLRAATSAPNLNGSLTAAQGYRKGGLSGQTGLPTPLVLSSTTPATSSLLVAIS